MKKIYLLCLFHFVLSQFPVDLYQNDISNPFYFEVSQNTETLLSINCSANTNWSMHEAESATLVGDEHDTLILHCEGDGDGLECETILMPPLFSESEE